MGKSITVKEAGREDIPVVLEFIRGLAEYEKLKHEVEADEETLKREMFDKGGARALIAFCGETPCGFALYFYNFSTFLGKRGIYLEDLFVRPDFRGRGVGGIFDPIYVNRISDYAVLKYRRRFLEGKLNHEK